MTRPSRVIIDRAALQHNFSVVKSIAPAARIMAIIKADAYGHGLIRVAKLLRDADAFGVACLEEASQLRDANIDRTIVLLEGPYDAGDIPPVRDLKLDIVIHNQHQIEMLKGASCHDLQTWIKVDTGMHRLGFQADAVANVCQQLEALRLSRPPRLMTHLAVADQPKNQFNRLQLARFSELNAGVALEKSVANSAAILADAETHMHWVRPGLMLYGVSPFPDKQANDHDLKPVMTLESELISVRWLKKNEPVGYGADWRCPEDMPIGTVATGYCDGFSRHARPGTPILVHGKRCALIGRVSMDMLTVDLRNCATAGIGAPVTLWGNGLPVEEIARAADTIPYELLCGVHKRLEFVERG